MSELVDWYRAQLDEDERVARAAGSRLDGSYEWVAGEANADGVRTKAGTPVTRFSWPNEMEHIARHDPARVLRDVAAKRAIVDAYEHKAESMARYPGLGNASGLVSLTIVLRQLASAYSDRPGYREEKWKP